VPEQPLTGLPPADWIAPRLDRWGTVAALVPRGFPAHARVLHPAPTEPPTTWARVCTETGAAPHRLMSWAEITRGDEERWGHEAGGGSLEPASLAALRGVLEARTAAGQDWFAGVWVGWGWLGGGGTVRLGRDGVLVDVPEPRLHPGAPELRLPHREYLLFAGPPREVVRGWGPADVGWHQSPSLVWPADRTWFVAGDTDLDSTYVGGSAELVAAVLAAPGLEAWPADPDDPLG